MQRFVCLEEIIAREVERDHGGTGPIEFRRLLTRSDFETPIDFVDYTIIPPGSSIGVHEHEGNDEIYFIVSGKPRIDVDGCERRIEGGGIAVVRSGQKHSLVNDTDENVAIFVIQVRHAQACVEARIAA